MELSDLNTSMIDIGHKASTHYKDLRIWKDSITTLQTAMEAIQEESNHRQLGATQAAICDHGNITTYCDFLEKKITEPKNYHIANNHVVTKGMRSGGEWKKKMERINKELSNLTNAKIPL